MKTKNAILLIIILFLVNYPIISMLNVPKDPATATGLLQEKIKFKTGSGDDKEEVLVIKFNKAASATTKLEINLDGVVCELKARDDGKHENKLKYKEVLGEEEKALFASVKYSAEDDDFKLVDANDKLLWKVKVFSEKVKISDNEEGNNYYQIKKNKKGKIKIYNQGEEEKNCGVVKYKEGKLKVKAVVNEEEKEDLYSCKELDDIYFAPGVLMLDKIPARERAIIVTELLRKGK